jgi:hypothetical protein
MHFAWVKVKINAFKNGIRAKLHCHFIQLDKRGHVPRIAFQSYNH